jgi:uncharacterized protein (TIGR02118 family)
MVRLISFVRRRPGMEAEEFHRHWRDRHGPLVAEALGHHLVRYEQYHGLPEGGLGEDGYDGVAVLTFAARADFDAFVADPAYLERVHPDEQQFLDLDAMTFLLTEDPEVFVDRMPDGRRR